MRRLAATATVFICAATLAGCSGSDADQASPSPTSASPTVEAPEETPTPEESATPDATDPNAEDPSMPGSIEELAAMSQAMIEEAGMTEISVGDLTLGLAYSARGNALVVTCAFPEGLDMTDSAEDFSTAVEPMLEPLTETMLPTIREIDPEAKVIVEYVQADGQVVYSQTIE